MSFLSILLFASTFYFAHMRPDDLSAMLAEPSVSNMETPAYQEQLGGFMLKMGEAVDQYMTPLMSQLDLSDQKKLKNMGMNGFASYVNYLLLLIREQEAKNAKSVDDEDYGSSLPKDVEEMGIEFDLPYSYDEYSPFIAAISPDE